jgi:hypothetical protein
MRTTPIPLVRFPAGGLIRLPLRGPIRFPGHGLKRFPARRMTRFMLCGALAAAVFTSASAECPAEASAPPGGPHPVHADRMAREKQGGRGQPRVLLPV